tara:strand:- start:262 stop:936 length:675 start_codon:yes stop_codon:yes gene_type:complete
LVLENLNQKEAFRLAYNVSRETMRKFEKYENILKTCQKKFNLIGKSTANKIWSRHFYDSAFSYKVILDIVGRDKNKNFDLIDVGSGAGFPGLVIALLCHKSANVSVTLIESNKKKAFFLESVIARLKLDAKVINKRAEEEKKKYDIITSRAVAPLNKLLKLVCNVSKKNSILLAFKGQMWQEEIRLFKKEWNFKSLIVKNKIDLERSRGVLLLIDSFSKKSRAR